MFAGYERLDFVRWVLERIPIDREDEFAGCPLIPWICCIGKPRSRSHLCAVDASGANRDNPGSGTGLAESW